MDNQQVGFFPEFFQFRRQRLIIINIGEYSFEYGIFLAIFFQLILDHRFDKHHEILRLISFSFIGLGYRTIIIKKAIQFYFLQIYLFFQRRY